MPNYGKVKVNTITYSSGGSATDVSVSDIATKASPAFSGTATGVNLNFTGTIEDSQGNVRKLGNGGHKTSVYVLASSDSGKVITVNGGNINLSGGVFTLGDMVTIVNHASTDITITPTASGGVTDMYLSGDSTAKTTVTLAGRGVATVLFVETTGNHCYISGAGLS